MKRMDIYDPVRDHPRFQALAEKDEPVALMTKNLASLSTAD